MHRTANRIAAAPARCAGVFLAAAAAAAAQSAPQGAVRTVREVRVSTRNVFSPTEAEANLLFALANALHRPTREDVLRTEVWLEPGDRVDADRLAELESRLRATGWFADVRAETAPVDDERADLIVRTRDRFSLFASASLAFVGGAAKFAADVGEANLLGTGKRVQVSARRTDQDESLFARYVDPQLGGSWHRLEVSAGHTDEGPAASVRLARPFKHLEDPFSWSASLSTVAHDLDYYRGGDVVARLPETRRRLVLSFAHAFGPRRLRGSAGADLGVRASDYSKPRGPQAGAFRAPGDVVEAWLGTEVGVTWVAAFEKTRRLDAIDYVEDVELGARGTLRLAAVLRDEAGRGALLEPSLEARGRAAAAPAPAIWVTLEGTAGWRLRSGRTVGLALSGAVHAFWQGLPSQTLAASVTWDSVLENEDAELQLTLGEDNGLRGYPARQFAGDRRLRLNIEDRVDTGLELWSFHLGLVVFCDVGWVRGRRQGLSMGEALPAAGFGLRLGSAELLGRNVVRLDVAWPLAEVGGEEFGVSISTSLGQVFGLFGNADELGR